MMYFLESSQSDRISFDQRCESVVQASIDAVSDDATAIEYIRHNPREYAADLWEQEEVGFTDNRDEADELTFVEDLAEAKARFLSVAYNVIDRLL